MKKVLIFAGASLAVAAVGFVVWRVAHKPESPGLAVLSNLRQDQAAAMEATSKPRDFIAKNAGSSDRKVQTLVTRARMAEAFSAANQKDYSSARAEFLEAVYKYRGTDAMSPDFGTLPDQAAYQAIVCLEAEGKREEAKAEYRSFMRDRKLSPLASACFRRLERINGKNLPEDEGLMQQAIEAQEARIRFETSVCGPKCLEKVLPYLGRKTTPYVDLAKICGTTDQGTTLDNLKAGCEKLGLETVAIELNAADFNHLTKPFVWLQADHYVAVLERADGKAHVYDPRFNSERWLTLPKESDASFRAPGLAFEIPTTELVSDLKKPSKQP